MQSVQPSSPLRYHVVPVVFNTDSLGLGTSATDNSTSYASATDICLGHFGQGQYRPRQSDSGHFGQGQYRPRQSDSGHFGRGQYRPRQSDSGHFGQGQYRPRQADFGHFGQGQYRPRQSDSGHFGQGQYRSRQSGSDISARDILARQSATDDTA